LNAQWLALREHQKRDRSPQPGGGRFDLHATTSRRSFMTTETPSSDGIDKLADQAAGTADEARTLTGRGVGAVRAGIRQTRDKTQRASRTATRYIKSEPIKSLLIAGAVGAALAAVVRLVVRPRDSRIDPTPRNPPE
jgi:hypothetical protein